MTFTAGFGFWIFMAVYCVCEVWLYSQGNDTLFWSYKTPEEKQLQQNIINKTKGEYK